MISSSLRRPGVLTALSLWCLVSVAGGCSDKKFKTYKVSGKVTFEDGTPVKFGRVEFYQPEQDVSARGTIREDGTFVIGTETLDDGAVAPAAEGSQVRGG